MGLTESEILDLWEESHFELSDEWRSRFLSDNRLLVLTQFQPGIVRGALQRHQKLDDAISWIQQQHSATPKNPVARGPGSGNTHDSGTSDRSRYSGGHYPHRPSDSDLHKRIGRTQSYEDDT